MAPTPKSAPRSDAHPWTLRVLEILSDGEWHPYADLVEDAGKLVPPGMAWRQAEESRAQHYRRSGRDVKERARGDRNDTIKTGQRHYVAISIGTLRRWGRVEVEYTTHNKQRQRPLRVRMMRPEAESDESNG